MKLIIYADESGTHEGSDFSLLAGWITYENVWNEIIPAWQAVLDKYKVEYFHFSEFAAASRVKRHPERELEESYEKNALRHLSLLELDSFYSDCATLLTNPRLQFEVAILNKKEFCKGKAKPIYPPEVYEKNPEIYLVENFIERCAGRILQVWGTAYESVTFIFDNRHNPEWEKMIKDVITEYAKWNWPIKPVQFKNKKEALPIQAADMLAYRGNQISRNVVNDLVLTKPSILDSIIAKRVHCPDGWESRVEPYAKGFQIKYT
ncbi:MAG: DUF3800 domain-containing protein [Verrucomicrobiota bacterium]|jgi:hypothetical protein